MDSSSFGNRKDITEDSFEVQEKREAEDLFTIGYSPLGIIIEEDLASLDFLVALEEIVDKNNIGCIGHSFGGTKCLYLSALDERVKVVVLSNSVGKFRENLKSGATQTLLALLPGIAKYTGFNGILGLISPRPLMIFYTERDPIYSVSDVEKIIPPLKELYNKLGKEENIQVIKIPGKAHEFPVEYHEQAYEFLDKNLKN